MQMVVELGVLAMPRNETQGRENRAYFRRVLRPTPVVNYIIGLDGDVVVGDPPANHPALKPGFKKLN